MKKVLFLLVTLVLLSAWGKAFAVENYLVEVSVGYADTDHTFPPPDNTFPSPWYGSQGVTNFIGYPAGETSGTWDGGAIMLQNLSSDPLYVDSVVVDFAGDLFGTGEGTTNCSPPGSTPCDPWSATIYSGSPLVIPGNGIAILAETNSAATSNFDSSDISNQGPDCTPNTIVAVVSVTVGHSVQITKTFVDVEQALNSGGYDKGGCGQNESHQWYVVHGGKCNAGHYFQYTCANP